MKTNGSVTKCGIKMVKLRKNSKVKTPTPTYSQEVTLVRLIKAFYFALGMQLLLPQRSDLGNCNTHNFCFF